MNNPNSSCPFELNYDVVVRIRPAGQEPVELVFTGGNTYALHPDHLRTFQGGFPEEFDLSVRGHTLVAMGVLLNRIAKEYETEAKRSSPPSSASDDKAPEGAGQFGALDLREDIMLTTPPPEFDMMAVGSTQEEAA